jgi:hypothetical protein
VGRQRIVKSRINTVTERFSTLDMHDCQRKGDGIARILMVGFTK